jgi:hypothetical protein
MALTPCASYSIIVRCQIENRRGMLGRLASAPSYPAGVYPAGHGASFPL